jgi:hypothetical protein
MPFVRRPEGFSSETLEMLDEAMSQLWLEQAAVFLSSVGLSGDNIVQQSAIATCAPDLTESPSGHEATGEANATAQV